MSRAALRLRDLRLNGARAAATPTTASKVTKPSRPETGAIKKPHLSRRAQGHAEARLSKLRLALHQHLYTGEEFKDNQGRLNKETRGRVRMLGTVHADGMLDAETIPPPRPAKWQTDEEIRQERLMKELGRGQSPLRSVDTIRTQREIEEEWGLMPGEGWRGQEELEMRVAIDVWRARSKDEKCMEFAASGGRSQPEESLAGVWRELEGGGDAEVETVARWAWEREVERRKAREWAVMDPTCRRVVGDVWAVSANL